MTCSANVIDFFESLPVGTFIANSASWGGSIGGSTARSYSYDELNCLVTAMGSYTGGGGDNSNSNYILDMAYDIMGNILHKNQPHTTAGTQRIASKLDVGDFNPNLSLKVHTLYLSIPLMTNRLRKTNKWQRRKKVLAI